MIVICKKDSKVVLHAIDTIFVMEAIQSARDTLGDITIIDVCQGNEGNIVVSEIDGEKVSISDYLEKPA